MDERDYRTYVELFRNMSNFMCKPSVIVFLDVSPEASAERIRARSRDVESKIELDYLQALYDGYQEFIASISKVIPVIRVDYERFATAEEMADVIQREYLDALVPASGHALRSRTLRSSSCTRPFDAMP